MRERMGGIDERGRCERSEMSVRDERDGKERNEREN